MTISKLGQKLNVGVIGGGFDTALISSEGVNIINAFTCSKIRLLKVLNNQLTLDIEHCQIPFQ